MRHLFLVAAFSLLPFGLSAAESADELFEKAIVAFSEAMQAEPAGSLEAYRSVREILDRVVDDFPTSDLAISILLSETISGLNVAELDAFIAARGVDLVAPVLKTAAQVSSASEVGQIGTQPHEARGCAPLEKEYVGNLNYFLLTVISTDHTGLAKNYYLNTHDSYEILANEMKDIEHYLGGYTSFELSDGTCLGYLTNPKSKANIFFQPDGIKVQYILPDRPQVFGIPLGFILDRDRLRGANLNLSESSGQANVEEGSPYGTAESESTLSLSRSDRREVQRRLLLMGFDPKGVDGIFGPGTRGAISAWQALKHLQPTGYINGSHLDAIRSQSEEAYQAWLKSDLAARSSRRTSNNSGGWFRDEKGMYCKGSKSTGNYWCQFWKPQNFR